MTHLTWVFATIFVAILGVAAESGEAGKNTLSDRVAAAAPTRATAAPKKARRLLVFTLSPGYRHSDTPFISAAIALMGKQTGAYETTVTDDASAFEPDALKGFDAVVMNNNCGAFFLPLNYTKLPDEQKKEAKAREARLRKSIEDFVKGGGGLIGIHSCVYTPDYRDWPEGAEMIGGLVPSHPWNQKIRILLDDPKHPVCAAFDGKDFEIKEETYQILDPYSREKVHVLFHLDPDCVDLSNGARKDRDYPLAWVKSYGQGRVFYTALTHYEENLTNPALLRFYLDGIQCALGDLEADTTPSAKKAAGH